MQESRPSRTAHRVAIRRAEHQLLDDPLVFADPLAVPILGSEAAAALRAGRSRGRRGACSLRAFLAVRSRYAEDQLAAAVARGVRQYVLLGAGLDTFAYRNAHAAAGLRVFEVDHPATQAWKRELLDAAGIGIPAELAFAPVDFERQTLRDALNTVGFRAQEPAFFSWLGVTPYLTRDAFQSTLDFVASTAPLGGVVFDYALKRSSLNLWERIAVHALSKRVAAAGEPFQLFFEPRELAEEMALRGFDHLEDLAVKEINARYFTGRNNDLRVKGGLGHLLSAQVAPRP
jgi:methyltransferase (TIGR00027 family)